MTELEKYEFRKGFRKPTHSPSTPGPWGVDYIGRFWFVIHRNNGRIKRIGPIGSPRINYFDRAMEEADRRNRSLLA